MSLISAFISPNTRPTVSQPLSRRGRPVLLLFLLCHPRYAGFALSSMQPVAFSVSLVSAPLKFPLLVDRSSASVMVPYLAAILMDSITPDAQALPSTIPLSNPQAHVQSVPPSFLDPDGWKWPPS